MVRRGSMWPGETLCGQARRGSTWPGETLYDSMTMKGSGIVEVPYVWIRLHMTK